MAPKFTVLLGSFEFLPYVGATGEEAVIHELTGCVKLPTLEQAQALGEDAIRRGRHDGYLIPETYPHPIRWAARPPALTVTRTEIEAYENGLTGIDRFIDACFYVTLSDGTEWTFRSSYHPDTGKMSHHTDCEQYFPADYHTVYHDISAAPAPARQAFIDAQPEIEMRCRAQVGETAFALTC